MFNGGSAIPLGIAAMLRRAITVIALGLATTAAWAEDSARKKSAATVILSDPQQGRTVGKVDGETVVLQKTPTGTVGKIGKDKVILHTDANGNTVGKVGDQRVFCHSDPVSGLTICK